MTIHHKPAVPSTPLDQAIAAFIGAADDALLARLDECRGAPYFTGFRNDHAAFTNARSKEIARIRQTHEGPRPLPARVIQRDIDRLREAMDERKAQLAPVHAFNAAAGTDRPKIGDSDYYIRLTPLSLARILARRDRPSRLFDRHFWRGSLVLTRYDGDDAVADLRRQNDDKARMAQLKSAFEQARDWDREEDLARYLLRDNLTTQSLQDGLASMLKTVLFERDFREKFTQAYKDDPAAQTVLRELRVEEAARHRAARQRKRDAV